MTKESAFIYESYSYDKTSQTLSLVYSIEDTTFTETFTFHHETIEDYSEQAFDKACFGLWVMAGISYYKTTLPDTIQFREDIGLTNKQRSFFTKTFLHGLGEFFYENDIDPSNKVVFPEPIATANTAVSITNASGTMIPLGGGKDSLTTIELLKQASLRGETTWQSSQIGPLATWSVGHADLFATVTPLIGLPHLQVSRSICPNLIKANKEGALNGHVPISAILAFTSVISAILNGKKYIALSNENSANHGNTYWKGFHINHQYSKSLEFEQDFQNYVRDFISPDIHYFSFLRPFSELKIAELFAKHCFAKYKHHFSSCNKNFHVSPPNPLLTQEGGQHQFSWCGDCPKCAFVFLILAPFVDRDELHSLWGENLLEKESLQNTFKELLGLQDIKPFECVGEIDECRWAAHQIMDQYPILKECDIPKTPFEKDKIYAHAMPTIFRDILSV